MFQVNFFWVCYVILLLCISQGDVVLFAFFPVCLSDTDSHLITFQVKIWPKITCGKCLKYNALTIFGSLTIALSTWGPLSHFELSCKSFYQRDTSPLNSQNREISRRKLQICVAELDLEKKGREGKKWRKQKGSKEVK